MRPGMFNYDIVLSDGFLERLRAREGLGNAYRVRVKDARRLVEEMLYGNLPAKFGRLVEAGLLDVNALLQIHSGQHIPFINAYYMAAQRKPEIHKIVMEHYAQINDPGTLDNPLVLSPLYIIALDGTLRNEWDEVLSQPNFDPNAPIRDTLEPTRHLLFDDLEPKGVYEDKTRFRTTYENILEYLCEKHDDGSPSHQNGQPDDRYPWRIEKIRQLLDAGCVITKRTRDLLLANEFSETKGFSAIIAAKEQRIEAFIEHEADCTTLDSQDMKDAYALGKLPQLFTSAQQDDQLAEALVAASKQTPTWLQDKIASGIALLDGSKKPWAERDIVHERAGRGRAGGDA